MIPFDQALKSVLSYADKVRTERIDYQQSLGRILAEDIISDMDMPPFNKSAVDGYAFHSGYIDNHPDTAYFVTETIYAGKTPQNNPLPENHCAKIMTGAMVPEGADCVVMVEDTMEEETDMIRVLDRKTARNICYRGEDIKVNDIVIEKGSVIKPADIAVLAAVGAVSPLVASKPLVGIISTGDELVEPELRPGIAKIRNSNAAQLMAQVAGVPADPLYYGITSDDAQSLKRIITKASAECHVVLLTGGVSMGDFDFVPYVLKEAGFELLFESISIQPGKPTVFARRDNSYIFGLPGNPVSAYVLFEILVKPFLLNLMGHSFAPREMDIPTGKEIRRRRSDRLALIPVKISNGQAMPVDYHGSAHINAYTRADAVMFIEKGREIVKSGETVHVRLL